LLTTNDKFENMKNITQSHTADGGKLRNQLSFG